MLSFSYLPGILGKILCPPGEPVLALSVLSTTCTTSSRSRYKDCSFQGSHLAFPAFTNFLSQTYHPSSSLSCHFLTCESDCVTPCLTPLVDLLFHGICSFNTTEVLGPFWSSVRGTLSPHLVWTC